MTVTTECTLQVAIADLQRAITSVVPHAEKPKQGDEQPLTCRVRLTAGKDHLTVGATDSRTAALAAVTVLADDRAVRFPVDDGEFVVDLYPKQARQIAAFLTPDTVEGAPEGDASLHLTLDAVTITDVSGKYPDTAATVPTIEQEATATLDGTDHLGYPDLRAIIGRACTKAAGIHKPMEPAVGTLGRFETAAREYGCRPEILPVGGADAPGWYVRVGTRFVGTFESGRHDDDSVRRRDADRMHVMGWLGILSTDGRARLALGADTTTTTTADTTTAGTDDDGYYDADADQDG